MKTVYKYELARVGLVTELKLPYGAQICRIDMQYGRPMLWASLDVSQPFDVPYEFVIVGTGHQVPDGFSPVSTFFELDGALVWHAFARVTLPWPHEKLRAGDRELMNG